MSDLEAVMERLLSDPSFRAALAASPDTALAGYALSEEDRQLLGVPVVSGTGADRTVETRTTKSGVVGMLGPVVSAFGVAAGQSVGSAPGSHSMGSAPGSHDSFGYAPRSDGTGTIGDAATPTETFGVAKARESFGAVAGGQAFGSAPSGGSPYETVVDVDGDGTWDAHTVHERPDGGVDVRADMNRDGRTDFVGHDDNRDGLIDSADYDTNNDGVLDTRMYDDNDDGWMDRSEPIRPTPTDSQSLGNAPSPS